MTILTTVTVSCPACPAGAEPTKLRVPEIGLRLWQQGALIQEALPTLSADEREMLMTGICPPCWTRTFGSEEA